MADWKTPDAKQVLTAASEDSDRAAWLRERRDGQGGTDAATLMGVNSFQSPSEMLAEKMNTEDPQELTGPILDLGHAMEGRLAHRLETEAGIKTRRVGLLRNKEEPNRYANPDRLTSDGGIAEFKTAGRTTAGGKQWQDSRVVQHALIQGMHYLGVTGRSHLWFSVGIRNDFAPWQEVPRRYWQTDWFAALAITDWVVIGPVERDNDLIEQINERVRRFQTCVDRGELDSTFTAMLPINERYPRPNAGEIVEPLIPDMTKADVQRYTAILEQEKELKTEKGQIAERIKETIGTAEALRIDGTDVATWAGGTRSSLDKAALEADHPGLLDSYTVKNPTRTFSVKGIK